MSWLTLECGSFDAFRRSALWVAGCTWLVALLLVKVGVAAPSEIETAIAELGREDSSAVLAGVERLGRSGAPRAAVILTALRDGLLVVDARGSLVVLRRNGAEAAASGASHALARPYRTVSLTNALRRALDAELGRLELGSPDPSIRRTAASNLAQNPNAETVKLLRPRLEREPDAEIRGIIELGIAKFDLDSPDPTQRSRAARTIASSADVGSHDRIDAMLGRRAHGTQVEQDPAVRKALEAARAAIDGRLMVVRTVSSLAYGLSLGSVLLLAALGLAITFGLMRVINMAHGEMLMIGAYTTFVTQNLVAEYAPAILDYYLLFAVAAAFVVTGFVGVILERSVIRFLYGRPLETLLATWGLSLLLIQAVRSTFGAQNVTVANPTWLSGGWELMPMLVVPYSRIAVLGFTALVVAFVWFVLQRTSLGLKVRAVTQNREIAASLGIATHSVDMWTFGLGSAVAGLGGVALSQLGNVGPELGQQHIIDCFTVVVLGGVGNIVGAVLGGLGLGVTSKFLEPSLGAVLGKIAILVLLILFIQWRPQGLFALKGRAQEG